MTEFKRGDRIEWQAAGGQWRPAIFLFEAPLAVDFPGNIHASFIDDSQEYIQWAPMRRIRASRKSVTVMMQDWSLTALGDQNRLYMSRLSTFIPDTNFWKKSGEPYEKEFEV